MTYNLVMLNNVAVLKNYFLLIKSFFTDEKNGGKNLMENSRLFPKLLFFPKILDFFQNYLLNLFFSKSSVIESAKSMVEWMSEKVLRMFEMGRQSPFQFRFVKYCHNLGDLQRVRSPKVFFPIMPKLINKSF